MHPFLQGAATVRRGGGGSDGGGSSRAVSLTLDHDVSDAAAVVTHFHVERVQHGLQLQAEHAAISGRFGCCTQWKPGASEIGIRGPHPPTPPEHSAPIRPGPALSACLLASGLRGAATCEGTTLVRKLMVDRRALVCRRKSREENSTWKHRTLCNSETPSVQSRNSRRNFNY